MTIADIKKNAEAKMAKSVEAYKAELLKVRTSSTTARWCRSARSQM